MTVYSSWAYGTFYCMAQRTELTLPNTDCICTVCRRPFKRAQSENKTQSGAIISNAEPLHWTKTTSTPATPIGQRAELITCLCFVNTLTIPGGTIAQQRCTGRSAIIRRPIVIFKYSPSESENSICNTSSQYNFLLVIWWFSLTNLTIYSHAMNWTTSASMIQ